MEYSTAEAIIAQDGEKFYVALDFTEMEERVGSEEILAIVRFL